MMVMRNQKTWKQKTLCCHHHEVEEFTELSRRPETQEKITYAVNRLAICSTVEILLQTRRNQCKNMPTMADVERERKLFHGAISERPHTRNITKRIPGLWRVLFIFQD